METLPSRRAAVEKRLLLLAVVLVGLKSWLVLGLPLEANSFYIYDDFHFLTQAEHLLNAEWLGPYDHLTLIKGPFYPLWIAAVHLTGLPLVFAQHLLVALAAAVFVRAVRPLVASPWARFALFAVLLFNPLTYSYGSVQRVVREGIYPALSLLTLAGGIAITLRRPLVGADLPSADADPPPGTPRAGAASDGAPLQNAPLVGADLRAGPPTHPGGSTGPGESTGAGDRLGLTSPPSPSPSQNRRWRGGAAAAAAAGPLSNSWFVRIGEGVGGEVRRLLPWSLLLGLSFAAFWLTREEGVWLLPSLALLLALTLWQDRQLLLAVLRRPAGARRSALSATRLPAWTLAALAALLPVLAVYGLNLYHYGLFNKTELDDAAFRRAYSALIGVRAGPYIPDVALSAAARRQIYAVSPAFGELQPYLEGDSGRRWSSIGRYTPVETDEFDFLGAGFVWALRDAVHQAGYYANGAYPGEYYRRLAAEIGTACAGGRLDCYPARASLAPRLRRAHLRPILDAAAAGLRHLVTLPAFSVQPAGSLGDAAGLQRYQDLTNSLPSGAGVELRLTGWAYDTRRPDNDALSVRLGQRSGAALPLRIAERAPTPELYQELLRQGQDVPAARFAGFTLAAGDHTRPHLLVYRSGVLLKAIPLEPGMPPRVEQADGVQVGIVAFTRTELYPQRMRLDRLRRALLGAIGRGYQAVTLPAVLLAAAAYAVLTWRALRRRTLAPGWLAASALLAAVAVRIALLAVIDATAFSSVNELYLSPAYPPLVGWAALSLAAAGAHLRQPAGLAAPEPAA